jgi:hypothetical protein
MGPLVGGLHVILNLFSSFLQMVGAILYTRLFLRKESRVRAVVPEERNEPTSIQMNWKVVRTGIQRALPDLKRIVPVTAAAIILFSLLIATGALEVLRTVFDPALALVGLPGESSTALMAQFLRAYAGYAIVASLLGAGILTLKQALLTLILGSMLVITLIYMRYTLPLNLSLFGRFGMRITILSYVASMAAKILTISLVLAIL